MQALQAPRQLGQPLFAAPSHVAGNSSVRGVALPARSKLATSLSRFGRSQSCAAAAVEAPAASPSPATPAGRSSSSIPADAAAPAPAAELFDWARSWYPVAALSSLKPDVPNAVQLLGQRLVVWQDKQGSWRAFQDVCPHRLVPLSEGRIHESGELQCTYHGWRFDSGGNCTSIPQIPEVKAHSTACASNRACVKAYPTQVLQDMLWVFGGSSPDAWATAAATPLPSSAAEELLQAGWTLKSPWFQRDVPLSFDVVMENLTDPAHVPQSHSGVIGNRDAPQHMTISLNGPVRKEGFDVTVQASHMPPYKLEFKAPSLVRWNFPGDVDLVLYGCPTAPGWSRLFMTFIGPADSKRARPENAMIPPLVDFFLGVIDKLPALQHALNRNAIIDGDTYFMHVGEREFYGRGGGHTDWGRQYYMPATADAAVLAWRRWIDRHGAALPVLPKSAADLPPLLPREAVFDRYNQHTKHCPDCSAALRNVTIAAGLAAVVAAVAVGSIVAAVVAGGAPLLSGFNAAAAGVAAVAGGLVAALLQLRQQFIYTDYIHAEH